MPDAQRMPLAILAQHLAPKGLLTRLAGWLARREAGRLTHAVIRWFVRRYQVNMAEAADPRPEAYASFNEFFTRPLRPGARPLAPPTSWPLASPVDGAISQFGTLSGNTHDQLVQAKGHQYSTLALLGGDRVLREGDLKQRIGSLRELAAQFAHGSFATLYLSPKDYHRIHMPCDGTLRRMIHVPGELYSVNPLTAQHVKGLFARNERVVCVFDTPFGPFVNTLVGATIVGSMATVWHGVVNPPRPGEVREWLYPAAGEPGAITLARGAEMGRFLLGSTVVMVWPKAASIRFNPEWAPGGPVRMGDGMAQAGQIQAAS
jgi:phosphatidylserine decarboxylase